MGVGAMAASAAVVDRLALVLWVYPTLAVNIRGVALLRLGGVVICGAHWAAVRQPYCALVQHCSTDVLQCARAQNTWQTFVSDQCNV